MSQVLKFLIGDYLKSNLFLIVIYTILNLVLYPINSIYMPQLYSELIGKVSKTDKSIRPNNKSKTNKSKTIFNFKQLYLVNLIFRFKNKSILNLLYFIGTIAIAVSILFRFKNYLYSLIFPKYKMWLRDKLFKKTLEKRNTDFQEQKVGKEIMRLEDIIFTTKEVFNFCIVDAFELSLISCLIIGYLFYLDKKIAFYATLQIVIIGILIALGYNRIKETTLNRVNSYYTIADNIDNSFTNLSNVLINNQTNKEVKKNFKHSDSYKNDSITSNHVLNNLSIIIRIVTIITFLIILYHGYKLTQKNKITTTNFTTIVILLLHFQGYLYGQTWNISSTIDRLWQIKYSEDYLVDLLSPDSSSKNLTDTITQGKIEFRNVNFHYKKTNQQVLKNLNLQIEGNEKVAIIGKSGSGKSTLVKLLIRFYKLQKGEILIDGIPHHDINIQYLRNKVNYVNQTTLLFDENIYYNIKYGNKTDTEYNFVAPSVSDNNKQEQDMETQVNKKIDNILRKYDLLTIYDNLENGLLTKAGPKGTKLSMGMQKVTILIRGLMRDSKIIIFDEPLAGLDAKTRDKVIKMIVEETKNKTVLVITHDKEIIPHMDRTVNLKDIQITF